MTPPELTIRPVQAGDFDRWLPLWLAYQRFYETAIPEAVTRATWSRFLDPAEPMDAALAEWQGEAVGMVHFIEHRSCWTEGNYMYLQDLYTSDAARGQGVASALIEHVGQQARQRGCSRVHWLTQEGNARARALYDRVATRSGFIQYRQVL